jgi:hypothetical protein
MISSLRNRHRIMVASLAVIAPAVFVAGVLVRKPFPVSDPSSIIRQKVDSNTTAVLLENKFLWKRRAKVARVIADKNTPSISFIELQAANDLAEPDALVYWSLVQPSQDRIPDNAKLLGKLSNNRVESLSLPEGIGYLILYSLAHRKIVAIDQFPQGGAK